MRRWARWATALLVGWATVTTLPGAAGATTDPNREMSLLFFGNSHTEINDVPSLVAALVSQSNPGIEVHAEQGVGYHFLDERLDHQPSLDLLASRRWTAVILQAQKYSSSGTRRYSTTEAEQWVRMVRDNGAVPIMFPEWPRHLIDETDRIFELHLDIATNEPVCVPPIPQAFDLVAATDPELALHAGDGNHSSPVGALLASMVIAHTLTGQPPSEMADVPGVDVDPAVQEVLRDAAQRTVDARSPWTMCPGDEPDWAQGTGATTAPVLVFGELGRLGWGGPLLGPTVQGFRYIPPSLR